MKTVIVILMMFASLAHANETRWIHVKDPAIVSCITWDSGFIVHPQIYLDRTKIFDTHARLEDSVVADFIMSCAAAKFQALQDGKPLLINLTTGETRPEDGFFYRK